MTKKLRKTVRTVTINNIVHLINNVVYYRNLSSQREVGFAGGKKIILDDTIETLHAELPEFYPVTHKSGSIYYINPFAVQDISLNPVSSNYVFHYAGVKIEVTDNTALTDFNTAVNKTIDAASANYHVSKGEDLIIADTSGIIITLPEDADVFKTVTIVNTSNGTVTITPENTLMNQATGTLAAGDSWTLYLDGTNWIII